MIKRQTVSRFSPLLVLALLATMAIVAHGQQIQQLTAASDDSPNEVPDHQLDPRDLADFNALSTASSSSTTPTPIDINSDTEATTTTTTTLDTTTTATTAAVAEPASADEPTTAASLTIDTTTTLADSTLNPESADNDVATTTTTATATTTSTTLSDNTDSPATPAPVVASINDEPSSDTANSNTNDEANTNNNNVSEVATLPAKPATTVRGDSSNVLDLISSNYVDIKLRRPAPSDGSSSNSNNKKADYANLLVRASDPSYQIEVNVVTGTHMDFQHCAISISNNNNNSTECLRSYVEIFDARVSLRINKALLPAGNITLRFRQVISGCGVAGASVRDIELTASGMLPLIYHIADQPCIYRVVNTDEERHMLQVNVIGFPSRYARVCDASVHIAHANNADDDANVALGAAHLQARFDTLDSLVPFDGQGVFVTHKYALVRVLNCYANSEPIEIKVSRVSNICANRLT